MFIAMNRFRVKRGAEGAFVEFHLLKGPEAEGHTLYSSHTAWQAAHARPGNDATGPLYLEHPKFEASRCDRR
jgi:heme-degrading monooxygenase HmoA